MTTETRHVTVCICTFRRPDLLRHLLNELPHQKTEGSFTYSVVVADNDQAQTAQPVVSEFAARSAIPVTYCVEPRQNIALARNKALTQATGDFIAFIDDDEYPSPNWLYELFTTCTGSGADGVIGPVTPCFATEPPEWAIRGRFFEKPTRGTGCRIVDSEMRTSNVMFRRAILDGSTAPFRAEFGTGNEDTDFFLRMRTKGCIFVSCTEAVVYEMVPPARCTRGYLLRRALHRGNNTVKYMDSPGRDLVKALIAIPAYCLALPFLFIAGEHHFVKFMMKICDHAGKVLALLHIHPFHEYL